MEHMDPQERIHKIEKPQHVSSVVEPSKMVSSMKCYKRKEDISCSLCL